MWTIQECTNLPTGMAWKVIVEGKNFDILINEILNCVNGIVILHKVTGELSVFSPQT